MSVETDLRRELNDWKRLFCALALQHGGELRVSQLSMASVLAPGSKTTFETFADPKTGERVFRVVPEESTPALTHDQ